MSRGQDEKGRDHQRLEDITEHKWAEEEMRIRDSAIASSINAIAFADLEGNLTYVNDSFLELWGYDHQNGVLGKPATQFWQVKEKASEVIEALRSRGSWIGELVAKRKDGSLFDVQLSASTVTDEDGKPICMMASFVDITQRKRAEAALRESEERYRALFEQSRDAVYVISRDGRVVDANHAMLELFGYAREEFMALRAQDIFVDAAQRRRFQREIEEKGAVRDYEVKLRKKDGTEMDCVVTSTVLRAKDGSVVGYQGIIRDITERKRAEEELIRLSNAVKMSTDSIVVSDLEGRIIDANEATLKMCSIDDRNDLIGKYFFEFMAPEERQKALAAMKAVLEKGYDRSRDYHIVTKDGNRIPVEISAAVMEDVDGQPIGFVGISRNITEHKRAQEEISHRAKQLAVINEVGQRIAPILDLDELYQTVVEVVQEKLGYQNVAIFSVGDDEVALEAIAGPQAKLMPSGYTQKIGEGMVGWVAKNGKTLLANDVTKERRFLALEFLDIAAELDVPIRLGGKTTGVLLVDSDRPNIFTEADVTTLETIAAQLAIAVENARLYEGARKRIDDISRLMISHELRGPLTNIKAAAQTLDSLVSDGDTLQRELVNMVQEESDRLAWFLDRIFSIAAFEAGVATPEWREVSLRSLIAKAADPNWLPQHDHRLEVLVEGELRVRADEGWTVMAIRNLLENAIKYCPPNSHIEVRASKMDEEWAKVIVADNGPGIAAQDLEQIFEKFYRGENGIKRGIIGHGLGLYLAKLLVEAQGGTLWVFSEEGKGANFSFSLPLAD